MIADIIIFIINDILKDTSGLNAPIIPLMSIITKIATGNAEKITFKMPILLISTFIHSPRGMPLTHYKDFSGSRTSIMRFLPASSGN